MAITRNCQSRAGRKVKIFGRDERGQRDYENMRTLVLLPSGARETMTYNADLRMARLRT